MSNTENNVAAQAGDEPMRDAFEAHIRSLNPKQLFVARWPDGSYMHHGTDGMWAGWQAAMATQVLSRDDLIKRLQKQVNDLCALAESQVSPRATADVERVTITPALRRAVDMTRADLGESGSNYPAVRELLAFAESHIATTKPGA